MNASRTIFTTIAPHGLSPGQAVTVSGVGDISFNGDYKVTEAAARSFSATPGCVVGSNPDASSRGGTVTLNAFASPRLNIPFITGSGKYTDEFWNPNDLMVPCTPPGVRRNISLYPAASLPARAFEYVIPMQYVDPTSSGAQTGSATQPWQMVQAACSSSPGGIPLLLATTTFHVPIPFQFCPKASVHKVDSGAWWSYCRALESEPAESAGRPATSRQPEPDRERIFTTWIRAMALRNLIFIGFIGPILLATYLPAWKRRGLNSAQMTPDDRR